MVAPDEMVGVPAHVLARLTFYGIKCIDVTDDPSPKLQGAIHDALFALDLDADVTAADFARLLA